VPPRKFLPISTLIAFCGLGLVVIGGRFLVDGAVSLARGFGISETVVGLTIVAVGTSMPELVTSVVAGIRSTATWLSATSSARTSTTSSGSAASPR
jgi:cation:H+ antiporter